LVDYAFEDADEDPNIGTFYPAIHAECLTPGSAQAWVSKSDKLATRIYSLKVSQWGVGDEKPWGPGVHLFSIEIVKGPHVIGTIATVIVPPKLETIVKISSLGVLQMLTANRRRGRI